MYFIWLSLFLLPHDAIALFYCCILHYWVIRVKKLAQHSNFYIWQTSQIKTISNHLILTPPKVTLKIFFFFINCHKILPRDYGLLQTVNRKDLWPLEVAFWLTQKESCSLKQLYQHGSRVVATGWKIYSVSICISLWKQLCKFCRLWQ